MSHNVSSIHVVCLCIYLDKQNLAMKGAYTFFIVDDKPSPSRRLGWFSDDLGLFWIGTTKYSIGECLVTSVI